MTARDFLTGLPAKVQPEALEGAETVFHFNLSGGQSQYTIEVKDGKMVTTEGLSGDPKCVVTATEENLVKIVTGQLNPMMAVFTGKIKLSNQGEMMKYAKIFGLM